METMLRVTVFYLVILVSLRILGKREFGQLSPLELITLLLIPELVSQALLREDFSMTNGLIAIMTLFVLVYFTSLLSHMSEKVEQVVSGKPAILVQHGKFIDEHMNRERVSPEEVFDAMHHSGLYDLKQVQWAILETDGKISIIPEDAYLIRKNTRESELTT